MPRAADRPPPPVAVAPSLVAPWPAKVSAPPLYIDLHWVTKM